ncbi:Rho termination factor N-terminal domain-containing protein [Sulfitobacter pontiacus]|uniref:Rho termination factor N-terminal domain-containing protein n=1 Tax=Sulfitobacter pontiacus TaxID=60137 RepID=UPI0004486050|nr:Rho termination factor N-terminal domain-containing protein [Sulfitobacter pontiacus]KAJ31014.1 hypothetical protein PM01_03595 [Sulfitobacter pontiacus 3SOLIMAR09]
MAEKTVKVKITSAIAIAGNIKTPGTTVEIGEDLAKNLINRGRAELAKGKAAKTEGDLGKMKVADLKVVAAELEIDGYDGMNQAKLIAAIEDARDA